MINIVSLRYIPESDPGFPRRGPQSQERVTFTGTPPPSTNKTAHSGFETQRRRHQKSKTGVLVAAQKELMASKNFRKKCPENCMKQKRFGLGVGVPNLSM